MRFTFRPLSALFIAASLFSRLFADTLGDVVDFQPARGWHGTQTGHPAAYPTLRYAPGGAQNAAILLSLLPPKNFDINDVATVRKLHLAMCRPYLAQSATAPAQTEFKLNGGFGVYSVFEDPNLAGKPSKPGDYKAAIPIAVSVGGKYFVFATILCDDPAGASQAEAWRFIRSLTLTETNSAAASANENRPAADPASPAFRAPPGFTALSSENGRFMYAGPEGVILSGWLDRAANFPGMRSFWAREKASLEKNLGPVANDEISLVAGWNVVTYTMAAGEETQQNLRACRVYGDTWVDVHLSQTGAGASADALKRLLPKLGLATTP